MTETWKLQAPDFLGLKMDQVETPMNAQGFPQILMQQDRFTIIVYNSAPSLPLLWDGL